jgi:hypothetical protein
MKQSPQDQSLHSRLHASRFSAEGFLGDDARSVDEIVAADEQTLEELGVSREELAAAMRDSLDRARNGLGTPVEVRPNVTAVYYESMGRIPSPFRGEGVFEKGEAVLTDTGSSRTLIITPLSIHLVEAHGFFQGQGSRYRIDPRTAVELLGK